MDQKELKHGNRILKKNNSLILSIIVIVLGSILVGLWISYVCIKHKKMIKIERNLERILYERERRVQHHIQQYIAQGVDRAQHPTVKEALATFSKMPISEMAKAQSQEFTKNLELFFDEHGNLPTAINSLLVLPDNTIVFSDINPGYVGINLAQEPYKTMALAESVERARMSLSIDISEFSYDPIEKKPTFFVSIPIIDQQKYLGTLVQSVPTEKIYAIFDDYIGLGKTGEVVASKVVPDGLTFVIRARKEKNEPFKKFIPYAQTYGNSFPLALASIGYYGSGVIQDYSGDMTISQWKYLPFVNWGMVAKISYDEVKEQLWWLWLFYIVITLVCLLAIFYIIHIAFIDRLWRWVDLSPQYLIRLTKFTLLSIGLFALIITTYLFIHAQHFYIDQKKNLARSKVEESIDHLEDFLQQLESVGQNIAHDLSYERIKPEELVERLKKDLKNSPHISGITVAYAPYEFSKEKKLYAPYVFRKNGEIQLQNLEESYDYTDEKLAEPGLESETWSWYVEPIHKKKTIWFDPYRAKEIDNTFLAGLSIPFYSAHDKKEEHPRGVVNIVFNLDEFKKIISKVSVGSTGYAMMISQSGAFIEYPDDYYITEQKTINELAEEKGSEELKKIAKRVLAQKKGFGTFYDHSMLENMYVYYQSVPLTGWPVIALFSSSEVAMPPIEYRHYCMALIFFSMLVVVALLSIIYGSLIRCVRLLIITFILFLLLLFYCIRITTINLETTDIIIPDQIRLEQFVDTRDIVAQRLNEKPAIKLPFGMYLYSLTIVDATTVALSGYIWEKFPKGIDQTIIKPIQFPQAIESPSIIKTYEQEEDGMVVMGWQFTAKLKQAFNYSKFPFDMMRLKIEVEHPDMGKNIMLIPAMNDYKTMDPTIPFGFYFEGFSDPDLMIKKTFFSYWEDVQDTSFGLQSYSQTLNRVYLVFNIIFIRKLFYSFILFFLPLLIISFFAFAVLKMSDIITRSIGQEDGKKSAANAIAAYGGLLLSIVILHQTFKTRILAGGVVYLEYLFFILYTTFSMLVIYTLLQWSGKTHSLAMKLFNLFKIFFWPLHLLEIFVITMIVFYTV